MVQTSETNSSDFWWEFFPQDCLAAIFSPWRKPVLAISPWKQFYQSNIQGYRPSWTWKDYHFSHDYPGETQQAEPDTWGLQTAGIRQGSRSPSHCNLQEAQVCWRGATPQPGETAGRLHSPLKMYSPCSFSLLHRLWVYRIEIPFWCSRRQEISNSWLSEREAALWSVAGRR